MNDCTILIIDDDAEDVEFISDALKRIKNIQIKHVSNAKQAYQYLEAADTLPALIVCDIFLMDSMGTAFLLDLKEQEAYKEIKAVFYSSTCSEHFLTMYPDLQVDCLQKPSDLKGCDKVAVEMMHKIAV